MKQPRWAMPTRVLALLTLLAGGVVVGKSQQSELVEAATGLFEVIMFRKHMLLSLHVLYVRLSG